MIRLRYRDYDPELMAGLERHKTLLELFNYLLLKTDGDAGEALQIMRSLQARGHLDPEFDLDRFAERLRAEKIIQRQEGGRAAAGGAGGVSA